MSAQLLEAYFGLHSFGVQVPSPSLYTNHFCLGT